MNTIKGITAVMLTPFTDEGEIDWGGCERLVEWYLANGIDTIFAVCQSSEMHHLTLRERVELARFVVKRVNGRVPVLASGHVSYTVDDQIDELTAVAGTGIDCLVLVTNRFPANASAKTADVDAAFQDLLDRLPGDIPLGLYECPQPFRRLLTDDQVRFAAETGRFVFMKDVSCERETVKRRARIAAGSPLSIVNASAAIAWPAMQATGAGFSGVFSNFHPDLYAWLMRHGAERPDVADRLSTHLVLAAMAESQGHPAVGKLWHQRLGTFESIKCRSIDYDILERHWALNEILDRMAAGDAAFRAELGISS
ncbi:MAG: dihydrodipicolinate synthase family protein [Pseudomonadota bacterium]